MSPVFIFTVQTLTVALRAVVFSSVGGSCNAKFTSSIPAVTVTTARYLHRCRLSGLRFCCFHIYWTFCESECNLFFLFGLNVSFCFLRNFIYRKSIKSPLGVKFFPRKKHLLNAPSHNFHSQLKLCICGPIVKHGLFVTYCSHGLMMEKTIKAEFSF